MSSRRSSNILSLSLSKSADLRARSLDARNILAILGGMPVRSTCAIMYGASDVRRVPVLRRARLSVACDWPFCVSMTASDSSRKSLAGFALLVLEVWLACLNTVMSIVLVPKPRSLGRICRDRLTLSRASRLTRAALPRTIRVRSDSLAMLKHVLDSCTTKGMAGEYRRAFRAAHRALVIIVGLGSSYSNILM